MPLDSSKAKVHPKDSSLRNSDSSYALSGINEETTTKCILQTHPEKFRTHPSICYNLKTKQTNKKKKKT